MVYLGLYGGMIIGLLGWYFGRRAAKKKNGVDEMHHFIWSKARSVSWFLTLAAIYVFLILEVSGVHMGLIPVLSILLLVHLSGWGITGAFYSSKMSETESKSPSIMLSLMIGVLALFVFAIISALTGNWLFFLYSLLPVIMSISVTIMQSRKQNGKT